MASFDFFWCCDIDLKHSENKCRHLVDCFINMNNCAIMMRDFRYLRVTSPDGRSLYEIYENADNAYCGSQLKLFFSLSTFYLMV